MGKDDVADAQSLAEEVVFGVGHIVVHGRVTKCSGL